MIAAHPTLHPIALRLLVRTWWRWMYPRPWFLQTIKPEEN